MNLTISDTSFVAGQIKQITVTVSGTTFCNFGVGDDVTGVRVSLDGTVWSSYIRLDNTANAVYVRVNSSVQSGVIHDGLGWYMTDGTDTVSEGVDITITGGVERQFESVSFSFAPRASTVQYNAMLSNSPVSVGSTITGNVLDHNYRFEVERVAEQGKKNSVTGASFATQLVNKMILYKVEYEWDWAWLGYRRPKFSDHLNAISEEIDIPIVLVGADFYPKTDLNITLRKGLSIDFYEQLSGTFGSILDRLIGWSNDTPSMTYNMYINNGTIYIIQRGHETQTQTLTPDNWALTPTITHTIRHTQWAESQYQTVLPKEVSSSDSANSNEPYNGTIQFGQNSLTYSDGYLVRETNADSVTTYTYNDTGDGKLLTQKVTEVTDPDLQQVTKTATTTYSYQSTGTETYLYEEHYTVVEDDLTIEDKVTRHVPIGGGWYGTTVIDNIEGEEVSTSLSQGSPGQKASQYMTDKSNDALKPATGQGSQRQMVVPLRGVARARQSYGVADYDTLEDIANCLDAYEGKEEITLTGEVVGGNHIYTYHDKIRYKGNDYYIVSNSVSKTCDKIRQSITAVRWVGVS